MNDRRTNALGSPSAEPSLHEFSQGGKTCKQLNEKESIELIARMISETKSRFEVGDGNILLNWGILTATIATVVWAAVAATGNPAFNGLWALMAFGWFFNRRLAVKQSSRGCLSYTDKLCTAIWKSVGILGAAGVVICTVLHLTTGNSPWMVMFFYALFVVGFGIIGSGAALKVRSMVAGGILSVAFGMVLLGCIFSEVKLSMTWVMPCFIHCFVLMMIIPGLEMRRLARKENERA